MADAQPRNSCRNPVKQIRDSTRFKPIYTLISFTNFIIKNRKVSKQIHLYTVIIQGKINIFVAQMPNCLVLKKKYILCCYQNFQHITTQSDGPQEWQDNA